MKLLNEYIYPNELYEYKDMYNWMNDLPQGEKNIFLKNINYFNNNYLKIKLGKKINILEIGTYAGISLIELVKKIPNSYGIGVDMWSNYNENNLLKVIDNYDVKGSFYKNINRTLYINLIRAHFFFFINDIKFFIKQKFIFINGKTTSNPLHLVKLGDVIQIPLIKKYFKYQKSTLLYFKQKLKFLKYQR
jgi:hypothetical protein